MAFFQAEATAIFISNVNILSPQPISLVVEGCLNVQLQELQKAVKRLEDALHQPKNEFIRDSVIQRFEFSVELAWKTTKKIMGSSTSAPKDVIREMAQNSYISAIDRWLLAIDMRNLSAHTYKEDLAEKVYDFAKSFLPELQKLTQKLSSK